MYFCLLLFPTRIEVNVSGIELSLPILTTNFPSEMEESQIFYKPKTINS